MIHIILPLLIWRNSVGLDFLDLEHPQQMCQIPNIWHIWHTKHKNRALSDVLNVSNFCCMLQYHCIFDTVRTQMAFVLYYFLFIFLSHPTLSYSISTSSDTAFSPPSLSNRPLSSEGWVSMWVYFVVGSSVG